MYVVTKKYMSFRALELDCLKNSHPIEVPVGHPSEIDEIFDDISYNKGASVIRMLHKYIGDDDFRKGMNIYLTRHQVRVIFCCLNASLVEVNLFKELLANLFFYMKQGKVYEVNI